MPIDVALSERDANVIVCEVDGKWEWAELFQAIARAESLMRDSSARWDIIVDLSTSARLPASVIAQFRRLAAINYQPINQIILVSTAVYVETLCAMFASMYKRLGVKYRLAATRDDAYTLIFHERET